MSAPVDSFLSTYFRLNPVIATFTGVHDHDEQLPDWTEEGLAASFLAWRSSLRGAGDGDLHSSDWNEVDLALARRHVDALAATPASHGARRNPSFWTGEAIYGAAAIMLRPSSPMRRRAVAVAARLGAIPAFLNVAKATLGDAPIPGPWIQRALRDCAGAEILLGTGIARWVEWLPRSSKVGLSSAIAAADPTTLADQLTSAALASRRAFVDFAEWLRSRKASSESALAAGRDVLSATLANVHLTEQSPDELLSLARQSLDDAVQAFEQLARKTAGSWPAVRERLAHAHPSRDQYLAAFERSWAQCRAKVEMTDAFPWPQWPLRYVVQPEWARDAGPVLGIRSYRSPAPEDTLRTHDYLVPPLPDDDNAFERQMRTWNHGAIKVLHVGRFGGAGHHVQNWYAYHRAQSRIGRIAGVDGVRRIGMPLGATMTDGWALYAADLMEEIGYFTPVERVLVARGRVRAAARAVADLELHLGNSSFTQAVALVRDPVQGDGASAQDDVANIAMFPGDGVAGWLGCREIHALRTEREMRDGQSFRMSPFHDALLAHGSIPMPLIAARMRAGPS